MTPPTGAPGALHGAGRRRTDGSAPARPPASSLDPYREDVPMAQPAQRYANHRRYFPLFHYFALPVLVVHVVVTTAWLLRAPSYEAAWGVVVALALLAGIVANRASALIVQSRVIRLETTLRLVRVLPPELRARIGELRLGHLVALRFASDEELPALVERCLAGELRTADEVKRAIRNWQADFVRA